MPVLSVRHSNEIVDRARTCKTERREIGNILTHDTGLGGTWHDEEWARRSGDWSDGSVPRRLVETASSNHEPRIPGRLDAEDVGARGSQNVLGILAVIVASGEVVANSERHVGTAGVLE